MERARPYLKVAAVVSAVTLVGALVAYRAGAFAMPIPVETQPEPQPAAAPEPAPEQPVTTTDQLNPAIMYGSKSAPAFPGVTTGLTPPSGTQSPPVFMGGSKSAAVIHVPPKNPNAPASTGPAQPVFMPGSKSFSPIPFVFPQPNPPASPPPAQPNAAQPQAPTAPVVPPPPQR